MSVVKNKDIKVSIITYVYVDGNNSRLQLFRENLDSVSRQKYSSYEHVIVDDGSKIDIKSLIDLYPNTVYVRKNQSGITASSHTFNTAIKNTQGSYIAILSSDDLHLDNSIEVMAKALDENPNWVGVCGAAIYSVNNERQIIFIPSYEATVENFAQYGCFINGCAVMFRKSIFKEIGMPPHFASSAADFDLWIRLAHLGKIGYISNIVVDYRDHSDSTRKKTVMPRQLRPKEYESGYYKYDKSTRIIFVISSAIKRLKKIKSSINPAIQTENRVEVAGNTYYLPHNEFEKLLPFLHKARNLEFKKDYLKKMINVEYKKVLNIIDEVGEVTFDSINPVSVVLSHFLEPTTKQNLNIQEDYKVIFYTEFFNWGYLDVLNAENEEISYLGLEGMVNKPDQLSYIDGLSDSDII